MLLFLLKKRGGKLLSIDNIKEKTFNENKYYDVKDESRGIVVKCKIIQQTDFLFVFQPLNVMRELDKRIICIAKVNWFLNRGLVKDSF